MTTTRSKLLWTLWMAGGGIAVGMVVYLASTSVWWTIAAVLASGVAFNAIGQIVTQPIKAMKGRDQREPSQRSSG